MDRITEALDSIGINGMEHAKTCYTHRNFCYGIVVFLVVVCLLLLIADQNNAQSQLPETPDRQNQNPAQLTQQDLRDVLNEQQETFVTQSAMFLAILGFLLLAVLIFLVWMFFQYRDLAYELDNVKHRIEISTNVNSSLKQDVLDVGNRIQRLAKTFDSEVLYQKLAAGNENNTREVLNFLRSIVNILQNEVLLRLQEMVVSSQQHENGTSEWMPPPAIVEFCNRYNTGIQDRQNQTNFLQHYQENYRICVENPMERRLNPQIDPIFKTDLAAGRFLACYIEDEKLYAVVPVYDLKLGRAILHPGAFVDVFKCPDFDPQSYYKVVKITQPAVFEPDDEKETWILKERGIVELQETK